MVKTRINIPHLFRQFTGGLESIPVEGVTVRDCLMRLSQVHPRLKSILFKKNGELDYIWLIVVDQKVVPPGQLELRVEPGQDIRIIPLAAGG